MGIFDDLPVVPLAKFPPSEEHQAREPGLGIQGGPRDEDIRLQGLHQEALDLLHRVLGKDPMEWMAYDG